MVNFLGNSRGPGSPTTGPHTTKQLTQKPGEVVIFDNQSNLWHIGLVLLIGGAVTAHQAAFRTLPQMLVVRHLPRKKMMGTLL